MAAYLAPDSHGDDGAGVTAGVAAPAAEWMGGVGLGLASVRVPIAILQLSGAE